MNVLRHYGTPRHSGRYPWGSGENPFQHESSFLDSVNEYRKQGLDNTEIAKAMGMSTTEWRKKLSIENGELKTAEYSYAIKLKDKGYSNVAIGERLGRSEGYVRNLLNPVLAERTRKNETIASIIKDSVDKNTYIDIGPGTELNLGISRTKLLTSVRMLEDEGYKKYYLKVPQAGIPGQFTSVQVLVPPGVSYSEVDKNQDKVVPITNGLNEANIRENKGDADISKLGIKRPVSVDDKRIMVRYGDEGGKDKDGVIELRRGVEDLSLGYSNYAQVRIAVNDSKYLKGMAVYSDDLPDGIDIVYNTNKPSDIPKTEVFKSMKTNKDGSINWDNPFGTTLEIEDGRIIGQKTYLDKDGNEKLSAINIVRSEGSWNTWSKTLASQFLSKQPMVLIKQQLNKSYKDKEEEYDEIKSLTNPEIKKKLLEQFADDCDASASHLKAAALPGQSSKVILPLTDISEKEIYAPSYKDGEQVVLIRYPHGGTFEIPVLTVNNKLKSGEKTIGKSAVDAVGINSKVAEQLSGADFDGDTVVVIPTKNQKIRASSPLKGLVNFDPKEQYGPRSYKGVEIKKLTDKSTQTEMGKISNLITDMTLKGANEEELARAVRHSMVIIDAKKHELNYKQSEIDNGIAELKEKYQGGKNKGASTLISLAGSDAHIPVRKEITNPKAMTPEELKNWKAGKKVYRETGETYLKDTKKGPIDILRTQKVSKMSITDDARKLSSGTPQENEYAEYANKLKKLANSARIEMRATKNSTYSPSAKKTYSNEVDSLNSKLKIAISNKPLERRAQMIANVTIRSILKDNPDIDSDELKKIKTQALASARAKTGASKSERSIDISDREWEAIQAGAISSNKLNEILNNTDIDRVKQLATPRDSRALTSSDKARIKNLISSGNSLGEVASATGFSTTTISNLIKEGE